MFGDFLTGVAQHCSLVMQIAFLVLTKFSKLRDDPDQLPVE